MADYYVDPSLNTDTGAGTVGDPWGHTGNEIQKAMDNITQGSTGDTIHVKAGGTVSFGGTDLDFTAYTVSSADQPLGISGYTTAAWDGGIGVVDLGGASTFVASTVDGIHLQDLDISGGTGSWQINADNNITIFRCKVDGGATSGGVTTDINGWVAGCEIINCSGDAVSTDSAVLFNHITQATANRAVVGSVGILGNICVLSHASANGILLTGDSFVRNNSVYQSAAGTQSGIYQGSSSESAMIIDNYVEGFSGTGGIGYEVPSGSRCSVILSNRWYNCTTGKSIAGRVMFDNDNSATTASGLTNAGSADYTPTAELIGKGFPSSFLNLTANNQGGDIGAIQYPLSLVTPSKRTYMVNGTMVSEQINANGIYMPRVRDIG